MKYIIFCLFSVFALASCSPKAAQTDANTQTTAIPVMGNCGMCKKKIETAALSQKGVSKANWDDTKMLLTVTYNSAKVTTADIEKKVAAVGYDTQNVKASDAVYNALPGCCQYDRKK
jgi:periplasmic mercuric ion binding protein